MLGVVDAADERVDISPPRPMERTPVYWSRSARNKEMRKVYHLRERLTLQGDGIRYRSRQGFESGLGT